jgi:hypothetical protein
MSKYAIENPTTQKVLDRGYEPIQAWRGGWYGGWRVKTGWKWQHVYLITCAAVRKYPVGSPLVKPLLKG